MRWNASDTSVNKIAAANSKRARVFFSGRNRFMRTASARLQQSRADKSSRTRSTIHRRERATTADKRALAFRVLRPALRQSEIIRGRNRREVFRFQDALRSRESTAAKKLGAPANHRSGHRHPPRRGFANRRFVKL